MHRCTALGSKLKAERTEHEAHHTQHREFLTDLAAVLGVQTLNPTAIKDTVLNLHLKYLDMEQHMQREEQEKFLYKQDADDKVAEAHQLATAAMTRALAAEVTAASANKRAAAAEAQAAASARSVAAAQTVADVEVSLAKQRAAAAEAKAAEVVQHALEDQLAAQQKAQAAEAEAVAATAAHKQAAALLTAALVDMQQQGGLPQASVAGLMQGSMFARIKALLSADRTPEHGTSDVQQNRAASPCSPIGTCSRCRIGAHGESSELSGETQERGSRTV